MIFGPGGTLFISLPANDKKMSSADNIGRCKQFGTRLGPTRCWAKLCATQMIFLKDFFKINFSINQQTTKKHVKVASTQKC